MFKQLAFLIVLIGCGLIHAEPEPKASPDAKAAPKPGAFAYNAPILSPGLAYTSAYTAPFAYSAYSAPYVAPYAAAYTSYSPYAAYSAPLVVV